MQVKRPRRATSDRKAAENRGREGERRAAWWLWLRGWRILDRRVRTPAGEVDLLVRNLVPSSRRGSHPTVAQPVASLHDARMSVDQVHIEARIRFLTTDEGGRGTSLRGRGSYRPNHNFFGPDDRDMCIGFIDLAENEVIEPGEAVTKEIRLLIWPGFQAEIREGREWRIQEGAKLVAIGTVLSVLED